MGVEEYLDAFVTWLGHLLERKDEPLVSVLFDQQHY